MLSDLRHCYRNFNRARPGALTTIRVGLNGRHGGLRAYGKSVAFRVRPPLRTRCFLAFTAMASLYTEEADRKRLAREAMNKLATSIPEVRAPAEKLNKINGDSEMVRSRGLTAMDTLPTRFTVVLVRRLSAGGCLTRTMTRGSARLGLDENGARGIADLGLRRSDYAGPRIT